MRIVIGGKIEEMPEAALRALARDYARVLVDLGTGNGKFAYETARHHADLLCIGLDAEARNLAAMSAKATRKPARGGAPNLLFVQASAEAIPSELDGLASHVTVSLPWGSLLRSVVLADRKFLASLVRLARPGALFELLVAYSPRYEPRMIEDLGLPLLSAEYVAECLAPAYTRAAIRVQKCGVLDNETVRRLPLAWGRQLARGRQREFHYAMGLFGKPARPRGESATEPLLCPAEGAAQAPPLVEPIRFRVSGHPNILAKHRTSIEFTHSADVTERGDCIVGVGADFELDQIKALLAYRKLRVTVRIGGVQDTFTCGVNGGFHSDTEIVFRKSAYRCQRTLGTHASKSAQQLKRSLVANLRSAAARAEVIVEPLRVRKGRPGREHASG